VCRAFFTNDRRLRYFTPADDEPRPPRARGCLWLRGLICHFVMHLVYQHAGSADFSGDDFDEAYVLMERGLLSRTVGVHVIVPMLNVQFPSVAEDTPFRLTDDVSIVKLTRTMQIARMTPALLLDPTTIGHASHAFRLATDVANTHRGEAYSRAWEYLHERQRLLDALFALLRLRFPVDTGYAQILLAADGWAPGWFLGLPQMDVDGVADRVPAQLRLDVPHDLDNLHSARTKAPRMEILERMRQDAGVVVTASGLEMALSRTAGSIVQSPVEDRLLDAVVGMEALLGDGSGEITYKVSVRAAAVYAYAGRNSLAGVENVTAYDVFGAYRKVYDRRSKIAHGVTLSKRDKRPIALNGETCDPLALAEDLLRIVIEACIANPELMESGTVERKLLDGLES
jgi:hypothetical protein